jgi:hypothetical protein
VSVEVRLNAVSIIRMVVGMWTVCVFITMRRTTLVKMRVAMPAISVSIDVNRWYVRALPMKELGRVVMMCGNRAKSACTEKGGQSP